MKCFGIFWPGCRIQECRLLSRCRALKGKHKMMQDAVVILDEEDGLIPCMDCGVDCDEQVRPWCDISPAEEKPLWEEPK